MCGLLVHILNVSIYFRSFLDIVVFLGSIWLILGPLTIIPAVLLLWLLHRPCVINVRLPHKRWVALNTVASVWHWLVRWHWLALLRLVGSVWLVILVCVQHVIKAFVLSLVVVGWTKVLLDVEAATVALRVVGLNSGWIYITSCSSRINCIFLDHLIQELFIISLSLDDGTMAVALYILVLFNIFEHSIGHCLVALTHLV